MGIIARPHAMHVALDGRGYRDEKDFVRYVDYIHYNTVKYDLVMAPWGLEYSSFHRTDRSGQALNRKITYWRSLNASE